MIQIYREERINPYTKYEKLKHEELGRLRRYLKCWILEEFFKGIYDNCKRDNYGVEYSYKEKWIATEQKIVKKKASKNWPRDTRNSARASRA